MVWGGGPVSVSRVLSVGGKCSHWDVTISLNKDHTPRLGMVESQERDRSLRHSLEGSIPGAIIRKI